MDPAQIALVLGAVVIGFFAKGLTGVGGPMIAIPILASFEGVEFAVAVLAIPTLAANVWQVWENRAAAGSVRRYLVPMLIAGSVGILIGVWFLVSVDERLLLLTLALVLIAYIAWYLTNPRFELGERAARRLAVPVGFVGGGIHGATGISAPVFATYIHSLNLPRRGFVLGVTVPFAVLGAVLIASLTVVGAYDTERFVVGLIATIPVVVVLPIASRLGERLTQEAFQIVVLVVLGAAAVRLLWSVFS